MPAIEAPPSVDSAVPRRRENQREMTAAATTWLVAASPTATSTP